MDSPQHERWFVFRPDIRSLVLVALLCVFVFAQSAALNSEHCEHHSPGHCCLLCHAGPQPLLQGTVSARFTPIFRMVWLAPAPDTAAAYGFLPQGKTSRAPPSA